ncbi:MAG TPA: prolyl oligopeptidase family serine peptidase, partial [Dehalococcoidia bacterium]
RLFVTGYSYGGFMTTWIIGRSNRFRAAIIGAPVSDQVSMRGTSDIGRFSDYEIGGTPYDNFDEWRLRSPIAYLQNCTTPVLIEHHEGDLRCPIGQAEEIFANLKMFGKEVEFVRYPGGFHTLDTHAPSQDVDYMRRQLEWFARHGGLAVKQPAAVKKRATAGVTSRVVATTNGHATNGARPRAPRARVKR